MEPAARYPDDDTAYQYIIYIGLAQLVNLASDSSHSCGGLGQTTAVSGFSVSFIQIVGGTGRNDKGRFRARLTDDGVVPRNERCTFIRRQPETHVSRRHHEMATVSLSLCH